MLINWTNDLILLEELVYQGKQGRGEVQQVLILLKAMLAGEMPFDWVEEPVRTRSTVDGEEYKDKPHLVEDIVLAYSQLQQEEEIGKLKKELFTKWLALNARITGPGIKHIYYAFNIVSDTYNAAAKVLLVEASASRLKFHAHGLTKNVVPILVALEAHAPEEHLPIPWVHECAHAVARLVKELCDAQKKAMERDNTNVESRLPFNVDKTSNLGVQARKDPGSLPPHPHSSDEGT
ncbi:hypothetical protein B0H11DRAFT_2255984 [Mycena galericulata]|nr:hypothetical protein B0H11DRAFT_2255984 [Mycena galericulata]